MTNSESKATFKRGERVMIGGGDWREFDYHGMRPDGKWSVRVRFSVYGGRAFSFSDNGPFNSEADARNEAERLFNKTLAEVSNG